MSGDSTKRPGHWAASQRKHYQKGGIGGWFRRFRDETVFELLKEEDHRIIDLGCGEGITLEALKKRFPTRTCLGIELNKESVETCGSYDLPVLNGSIYHLAIRTGSTDCCLTMDVIEHLDYPEDALKEIHRILKPGRSVIVVFPNDRNFFWSRLICLKWKEAFYDPGHVKKWHPKEMEKLLGKMGFRVTYRRNVPFHLWSLSLYHIIQAEKR